MHKMLLRIFRVRPDPKNNKYVLVKIFKSQEDMYYYCRRYDCEKETNQNYLAKFEYVPHSKLPLFGIIYLCIDDLNTEIVVHESVHAAIEYYRLTHNKKLDLGYTHSSNEEVFCDAVDKLAQAIVTKLRKKRFKI